MRFVISFLLLLSTGLGPVRAQGAYLPSRPDSTLNVLIAQRARLYQTWKANEQERHALFGGQSKNDLRRIIQTLEQILAKDNEILAELNRLKEQETTELRRKNSDIVRRSNEYLVESSGTGEQVQRMEMLLKQERARARAAETNAEQTLRTALIAGAFLLAAGIFVAVQARRMKWWKR
jgi:predicted ATP-dependent protease